MNPGWPLSIKLINYTKTNFYPNGWPLGWPWLLICNRLKNNEKIDIRETIYQFYFGNTLDKAPNITENEPKTRNGSFCDHLHFMIDPVTRKCDIPIWAAELFNEELENGKFKSEVKGWKRYWCFWFEMLILRCQVDSCLKFFLIYNFTWIMEHTVGEMDQTSNWLNGYLLV